MALPVQEPLEMLDDGIEGTVGMIRGTAQRQLWSTGIHYLLGEHAYQAGFANPRLTTEQHHLPPPLVTLRPALAQQPRLVLPSYQGCEPAGPRRVEATLGRTFAQHAGDLHGCRNALKAMEAEVV